jgi:uncharacterized protein (DUF849 family)
MISDKVIITCAVTGSSLSPSMSPHLPVTPDEIARQPIDAVAAGAAVVHLHARDPRDGRPTNETTVWAAFVERIRAETDAIINMSASLGSTAEDRLHHLSRKPVRCPIIVQFLTGILGGIPSDTDHLLHMKRSAVRHRRSGNAAADRPEPRRDRSRGCVQAGAWGYPSVTGLIAEQRPVRPCQQFE